MEKLHKILRECVSYLFSLAVVMLIASVLILIQGADPLEALTEMIKGAVGSKAAIASSIRWSTPVIVSATAAVIAQRSGINNLGIEGQVYFGAFTAALAAVYVKGPAALVIILSLLTGAVAGLLYAVLPAVLKLYFKIDEMITTLMLNYVAIQATEYLTMMVMGLDSNTNPEMIATPEIAESVQILRIMPPYQADAGFVIAIALGVAVFLMYRYTRVGYEWKMIGRNQEFARYGGIRNKMHYMIIFLLSGAVAGVCGSMEMLGPHMRFRTKFAGNIGWDGIMVALVAKNNPLAAVFIAIVWGMIKAGSLSMERMTSVNRVLVTLVQALFVLFLTVDFKELLRKLSERKEGRTGV